MDRMPAFAKNWDASKVGAVDLQVITTANDASGVTLSRLNGGTSTDANAFDGPQSTALQSFKSTDNDLLIDNWQLTVTSTSDIEKLWLVVRYVLKKE
jgi:hypothetical protein